MKFARFGAFALSAVFTVGIAGAQTAKQDMKDAGHETKAAAVDTGHATKRVVKKGAHKTRRAAHKVHRKLDPQ